MRLVLALIVAVPAFGNITTSSLTGRVNVADAPAAGVTVTASSTALQQPRATITNARGRYWLGALPPGTYDVTFSLEGHTTLIKRAVLELGRVARADATLEPNPDEDSITSTVAQIDVANTIPITSHFSDRMLDRMPQGRIGTASLAPGTVFGFWPLLDGMPATGFVTSEETIEQSTVVRGAPPAEWDTSQSIADLAITRSGGDEFSFTLRDTMTDSASNHFGEATAGGRVVPQRLWFFAAAWRGESSFPFDEERNGTLLKLDAQIGTAHHFDASYNDSELGPDFATLESETLSLRYTGAYGPRFTSEIFAGRTTAEQGSSEASVDYSSGRASYIAGDHLLTAGMSTRRGDEGPDTTSFFASDRWSFSRWNVSAGVRYDEGEFEERFSPRIALTYDFRGNGRQALSASWGEYPSIAQPQFALRTWSLGYATAIGNSGAARIDVLRHETGAWWMNELQLDARYSLFDRFHTGATYTYSRRYRSPVFEPVYFEHDANVWAGAELPIGSHEFGVTLLQHYMELIGEGLYPTDVALRYSIPFSRAALTIAADATNVFGNDQRFQTPRALRFWVRLQM